MMSELNESMHALRRAAGHFAHGAAERLSPTYDRARHLAGRGMESTRQTMSSQRRQARESMMMSARAMRRHKKEAHKHSRMRTIRRLLLTGAAVGVASAAVARRRRQQAEWAEYEQMGGFDESRYAEKPGERSAKQKVASSAASMADSLSARAGRIADSLHERSAGMPEKGGREGEGSTVPLRESPSKTGPGPMGTPSAMGSNPSGRERMGDPALDFPSER
ncbi:MAG: hypothetical protein IRY85_20410 [Micromonosporaceae bacterium]|nr:hypothetical protein [Micromonosporaceae bacterium]